MTGDKPTRWIGVDDKGRPVGEYRHGAKLTAHEIDLIFELRAGDPSKGIKPMKLKEIAEKFEVSKTCISFILNGLTYSSSIRDWKKV
jgi:hypothetical protein